MRIEIIAAISHDLLNDMWRQIINSFLEARIFVLFEWGQHHFFGQCSFLIHHRISLSSNRSHNIIVSLQSILTSFSSTYERCSFYSILFFACNFHFIQTISYRSGQITGSSLEPFTLLHTFFF